MSAKSLLMALVTTATLLEPRALFPAGESPDVVLRTNSAGVYPSFSPDGQFVIAAISGQAKLWRIADTNLVRTFPTGPAFFSPDGTRIAAGSACEWLVADGALLGCRGGGTATAYSPDGICLAVLSNPEDLDGRVRISCPSGNRLLGTHTDGANAAAFSPDGTLLVSGGDDGVAKIWRVSDDTLIHALFHAHSVLAAAFSPDGQTLATSEWYGDTVIWWTNGVGLHRLPSGHTTSLKFSPDGKLLLTASGGYTALDRGKLKFWRVADGQLLKVYDEDDDGGVHSLDISSNGLFFAYSTGNGALVVARMPELVTDVGYTNVRIRPDIILKTNAHPLGTNLLGVASIAFSSNGQQVVSARNEAKLWRMANTNLLRTFSAPYNLIQAAVFSPDDTRVAAVVDRDDGAYEWRILDGALVEFRCCGDDVLAYSPDGSCLAVNEGSITLWCASGKRELAGHLGLGGTRSLAFSGDGRFLASGGVDDTAKLWRLSDDTLIQSLPHPSDVLAVAFSPDGKLLATGCAFNDTRIWSTNGTLLRTITNGNTTAVRFSPDGRLLLTASDGRLEFWRVADGIRLVMYAQELDGGANCVDISRDGRLFACGLNSGAILVARMPLLITEIVREGAQTVIYWQGGSGRYQVQQRSDLGSGDWENAGQPTSATRFTNDLSGSSMFYRIESLTN